MRLDFSWVMVLAAVGSIAAACGDGDASKTKISRPAGNRGGTANGSAGRGSAGTTMGQAGGGGSTATGMAGEAGTGAQAGNGGSAGKGMPGTGGGAGENNGATGGSNGATGGRGGSTGGSQNQAGEQAGGSGGEGGTPVPVNGLYVGTIGNDETGTGERPDPFATLQRAAEVAQSGDTIIFLDGDYEPSGTAIDIPDGVNVVAENPGSVNIASDGGDVMNLLGSSHIDGFVFSGLETIIRTSSFDAGEVLVTNSRFESCANSGAYPLEVVNQSKLTLSGTANHDWGDCAILASVEDSGELTIDGGVFHFNASVATTLFTTNDLSTLNLDGVTATDGNKDLLIQYGSSQVNITDSVLQTAGGNLVTLNGQASFNVTNSDVSIAPSVTAYHCIQTNMDMTGEINLSGSHLHQCGNGINGVPPALLTITNTEIDGMTNAGLELVTGNGGIISITGSHFHDNTAHDVRLFGSGGGTNIAGLTVRGTIFGSAVGLMLEGAPSSIWDLGTLAEAGGNTFQSATCGLQLYTPVITGEVSFVSAVGNTWVASVQNADGSGHYGVSSGTKNEVTAGVGASDPGVSGRNFTIGGGPTYGATIRLAEIP